MFKKLFKKLYRKLYRSIVISYPLEEDFKNRVTRVFVLTASKLSFDTFLDLSDDADRSKNDYIFINAPEDIINSADNIRIRILADFCSHPEIVGILKVLNKGMYFSHFIS